MLNFYRISCLLLFLAISFSSGFAQKRVLLEKYTSAFCGNCPNAHLIAEDLKAEFPELILVFHHSTVDGMGNPYSTEWRDSLNVLGTPFGMVDRSGPNAFNLAVNPVVWNSRVQDRLDEPETVQIELNGSYTRANRMLELEVSSTFTEEITAEDLRLSIMIVEDSLIGSGFGWDQSNYFNNEVGHPLYNLGQPILDYPHHHVLREILDGTWGTPGIFPTEPELNSTYSYTYSYQLPAEYNEDKIQIVALVSNYDSEDILNRQVLNAAEVPMIGGSLVTSVEETELVTDQLQVYPNPAKDHLWIGGDFAAGQQLNVELLDQHGRQVQAVRGFDANQVLDISKLTAGVYVLRVQLEDRLLTKKVLIQQ